MKIAKISLCISVVSVLATLPPAYANQTITNCTQVTALNQNDSDSVPNNMQNNTPAEDDEACAKLTIPYDYGDAPDPSFPTLSAKNGARHQLSTDVYLGKCVDGDTGSLQGAATADDQDAGSPSYGTCANATDEDGVTFGKLTVGGLGAEITIEANSPCKLNAWLDWDADGSWSGTGEQILLNQQLVKGSNALKIDVPKFAKAGETYARFRCSTAGNDGIGGEAADGEVEDYKVSLAAAVPTHSIGNFVWVDDGAGDKANADNGKIDAGEKPVADGVVLELRDGLGHPVDTGSGPIKTQTNGGYYLFADLPAGDYQVCLAANNFAPSGLLPNYKSSKGVSETPDTDNVDNGSDAIADGACSSVITLDDKQPTGETPTASGKVGDDGRGTDDARSNLTVDFGVVPPVADPGKPVSLGNRIWVDSNANGQQDKDEPNLANATVTLVTAAGNAVTDLAGKPVAAQTTDAQGAYHFTNLPEGDYIVKVVPPPGYTLTLGGIDADDDNSDTDSNCRINKDSIETHAVTLNAGLEPDTGVDGDDANTNSTVDCGFYGPVSLGNRVWLDKNADGVQAADEIGIAGVDVRLFEEDGVTPATDMDGKPVAVVPTDINGNYIFSNLKPGNYVVTYTPKEAGYQLSKGGADADTDPSDTDSNCKVINGKFQTLPVTLMPGTEPDTDVDKDNVNANSTVDCGMYRPVGLGSRIWIDLDGNGKQNNNEPGVPKATVTLLNADGTPAKDVFGQDIPAQTTDIDGKYFFGNLAEGKYIVKVTPPAGYEPTAAVDDPNNDDSTDSNGTTLTTGGILSNPIDLTWGAEPVNDGDNDPATNLTIDFGFKPSLGAAPIPTLSEWSLILMSLLMAVTAFFRRRER